MTLNELNEIFEGSQPTPKNVPSWKIADISKKVNVTLEIDRQTLEYYYSIPVKDILNSKMTREELEALDDEGWVLDNKKQSLVIFIV